MSTLVKQKKLNLFKVPLHQIKGIDVLTKKMLQKHVGFFPYTCSKNLNIPPSTFDSILELNPIILRKKSGVNYVVGNLRIYELIKNILDPNYLVEVKYVSSQRLIEVEKLFWSEHLLAPIINLSDSSVQSHIFKVHKAFTASPCPWSSSPLSTINSKKSFAKLLGVDVRSLK